MKILFSTYSGKSGILEYEEKKIVGKFGESRKDGVVQAADFINTSEVSYHISKKNRKMLLISIKMVI